jgi:diguanylate cyclase (GGDEF)-like protein
MGFPMDTWRSPCRYLADRLSSHGRGRSIIWKAIVKSAATAAILLSSQTSVGMAARDPQNPNHAPRAPTECLSPAELAVRLDEEVSRAERQHTALSCLLVSLDHVEQLARTHGEELPTQALAYLGGALGRELRRFDRVGYAAEGELLVVLPGADERRGEIVARRALGRLHAVKIELDGKRQSLQISMGIAAWSKGLTAEQLLSQTRLAAQRHDPADPQRIGHSEGPQADAGGLPVLRPS